MIMSRRLLKLQMLFTFKGMIHLAKAVYTKQSNGFTSSRSWRYENNGH
jgi:hypothetical protein